MKNKILLIALLFLAFSCGSDDTDDTTTVDDTTTEITVEEGRSMQISDLYDYQISVNQLAHVALLNTLVAQSVSFSANPTEVELVAFQEAWKNAFLSWKANEVFNLGAVQNSFIHTRINTWPINVETIEENILGDETLDNAFVASSGANTKGYTAIEYFLFHEDATTVLTELTTAENADRRMNYVLGLVENLQEQSTALQVFWGEVEPSFKTNLETGVNGSQNQVVNALIAMLESMKGLKIEDALNAESDGVTNFEAFRSRYSKEALIENLLSIRKSYTGDFDEVDGFGLDDYLIEVLERPEVDTAIQDAIQVVLDDLNSIDGAIEDTLETNVEILATLQVDLQTVIGLFKTDFSSAANIVVTFNDNDGD